MEGFKYSVRLFQYGDDWIAEYPDLPGCTGVGYTPEEALASGEVSKELWLEDYFVDNHCYPEIREIYSKDYSGKFNLRITPELHRELVIKADEQNVSLNQLCGLLLAQGIEKTKSAQTFNIYLPNDFKEETASDYGNWSPAHTKHLNIKDFRTA